MSWINKILHLGKTNRHLPQHNPLDTDLNSHLVRLAAASKVPLSAIYNREYLPQVAMELDNFKLAVEMAKDPQRPDRTALYKIYEKTLKDLHLRSQLRTALHTLQFAPFEIRRDGYPDDELTQLFDTTWFDDFIRFALEAEFWGHSLIEFTVIEQGRVREITLIDRFHVVPEFGIVRRSIYDEPTDGIRYADKPEKYNIIEIGSPFDLGLLELAAIAVIWKNYALSDWSEYMDRYGMPFLVMRTDTRDGQELNEMKRAGDLFGLIKYAILSKDTDVQVITPNATAGYAYQTFDMFRQRMDEYLSKLINGQTATSDEKSFVGSAEVQERILNKYTLTRLRKIQRLINDRLFPLLQSFGYPLQGARFQYLDLENVDLIQTEKKNA